MNKIILLIQSIVFCQILNAQVPPNGFNYSGVARNSLGDPIANQTIGIQASLIQNNTFGPVVYTENHFINTDAFGIFNLIIGGGAIQFGDMSAINWSSDNFFLRIGMDANGGNNFLTMGTTQLLSVPYALHAKTAESVVNSEPTFSGDYNDLLNAPTNVSSFANDAGYISNVNDDSPTNELQQLSVSASGDTLKLQNGGYIIIPGISAANSYGSVIDIDGNTYPTIRIMGQVWMAENLRATRYSNGDLIANVTSTLEWSNTTEGAWCHYENNSQYEIPYGKLYNGYAAIDTRNVCPIGWHVPSYYDMASLIDAQANHLFYGAALKSTGDQYWPAANVATNESRFSALPGGTISSDGSFGGLGTIGFFWTNSLDGYGYYNLYLQTSAGAEFIPNAGPLSGFSIRCLMDE
jgi:uncharacterized protein (TIGR02145 family)